MPTYHEINVDHIKKLMPPQCENLRGYETTDGIHILISIDHGRHHLSISKRNRLPTWEEIKDARMFFLPVGKHFVMALPPPQHYVNHHPFTMYLWELLPDREKDLIWTFEQG